MHHVIIKAAKDRDLYMEWSSVAEGPIAIYTSRQALIEHLKKDHTEEEIAERLARTDEHGTSALPFGQGYRFAGWNDESIIVEQRGMLPRSRFTEFMEANILGNTGYDLLEPFEDAE